MFTYPAKFERDGDGFLVTFPDLPEAITGGATEADAMENAIDALEVVLLTYASEGREPPTARRRALRGGRDVSVSAATAAKLAFIDAFRNSGMTRVAVASRLGKGENEVRRMLDPYHNTKLPALEAGLRALGKRLVVSVAEAA